MASTSSTGSIFEDNMFYSKKMAIMNSQGHCKERMGFSTTSTGKLVKCPHCSANTLFLHQYRLYSNLYCCSKCFDECRSTTR